MLTGKKLPTTLTAILSAIAIAPLSILPFSLSAKAADFSHLYTFGDSLVDTGNAFNLTGIPPEPYFEGRFANGPIWTEYLSDQLGIGQTSFGFGGALTSEQGFLSLRGEVLASVPGLLTQVNRFAQTKAADPDGLYILWAGANDYLSGSTSDPGGPVNNLVSAVNTLSSVGAQDFLLVNQPDLGNLPLSSFIGASPETIAGLNQLSEFHNQGLKASVAALDATGINAQLLDANALIRQAQAGELGFDNITDACLFTPTCVGNDDVESSYLFWDGVHPTTRAHFIVAEAARNQLTEDKTSVPEPGVSLGLLLLSGLTLGQLKREFIS